MRSRRDVIMHKYKDNWQSSVIPVLCTLSQMVTQQMTLSSTGEEETMRWRGWTRLNCPSSPLWTISSSPRMSSSPQVMVTNGLKCMNRTCRRREFLSHVQGWTDKKQHQYNIMQSNIISPEAYLEAYMFNFCTYTHFAFISILKKPFNYFLSLRMISFHYHYATAKRAIWQFINIDSFALIAMKNTIH